jgi:hypothetical protein
MSGRRLDCRRSQLQSDDCDTQQYEKNNAQKRQPLVEKDHTANGGTDNANSYPDCVCGPKWATFGQLAIIKTCCQ